ncbi:MAG: hypothetical protein SH820_09310 [Xanthomonadales bacterium]|nr:hypothetical protein [Xanthomonadales bacterium]
MISRIISKTLVLLAVLLILPCGSLMATPELSPDRNRGEGPFPRLVLRGVNLINGEGAPPLGPVDIVIEGNRIASIHNVGNPGVPIKAEDRPEAKEGDKVLELNGYYVMPGFVDMHGHFGTDDQGVPSRIRGQVVAGAWCNDGA